MIIIAVMAALAQSPCHLPGALPNSTADHLPHPHNLGKRAPILQTSAARGKHGRYSPRRAVRPQAGALLQRTPTPAAPRWVAVRPSWVTRSRPREAVRELLATLRSHSPLVPPPAQWAPDTPLPEEEWVPAPSTTTAVSQASPPAGLGLVTRARPPSSVALVMHLSIVLAWLAQGTGPRGFADTPGTWTGYF